MPTTKPSLSTQDVNAIAATTGNLYESTAVIAKRAKQIATRRKAALTEQLEHHFAALEEVEFPDEMEEKALQERTAMSRTYEQLPQPVIIATEELKKGELSFRYPEEEGEEN